MSRYIDADKIIYTWLIDNDGKEHDGVTLQSVIDMMPTADVRENVRGEWISHDLENGEKSIDKDCCSVCGERFREIAMTGCEWNFCPNCRADMRGDKDEDR